MAAGQMKSLNLTGLRALDLRTTRPDGKAWDFTRKSDRRWAEKLVEEDDPDWLVGAPPCTAFCTLNLGTNYSKMHAKAVEAKIAEGTLHMKFVCKLYRRQIRKG